MSTRRDRAQKSVLATLLVATMLGLTACGGGETVRSSTPTAGVAATATERRVEPTATVADGWGTYTYEEDGFSVEMPGEPQTSSQSMDSALGELTFYFFQLTDGGTHYAVSYNDYPVDMSEDGLDPETLLSESLEATAQGGKIENTQQVEIQGHPGIDGEMSIQETSHIWYRSVLVSNRLYQLVLVGPEVDKDEIADEARRFVESFRLTNP